MKKKDLLVSALGLSIGLGIMYMGKAKIIKNLIKNDNAQYDEQGKLVVTSKGSSKSVSKTTVEKENGTKYQIDNTANGKAFDYNNPKYHAQAGYWKSGTTGIFYLPLVDDNGVEYDYAELKIENDGKIEIPLTQAVKAGIFFWK